MNEKDGYEIASVKKALKILQLFSEENRGLTLSEISKETGINKSTALRMIATLVKERFLMVNEVDKTYSLGISVYKLGKQITDSSVIQKIATPLLQELADDLLVTTHLAVYDNELVTIVAKLVPDSAAYVLKSVEGGTLPIHCSGMGKLYLASLPEKKAREILVSTGMAKYARNTITDIDEFISLLPGIAEQGFATSIREHEDYAAGIACPVFNEKGKICGSISAGGICEMFQDVGIAKITEKVKKTAARISSLLENPPVF